MESTNCLDADAAFGPQVAPSCRAFDFTRTFEESFFGIAPSAVFVAFAASRAWRIALERPIVRRGWLYAAKLLAIALLAAAEVVQLALWATRLPVTTHTTLPSSVLAVVVTFSMLVLSHLEHRRSFRPSSLLCTYLFVTLVLDLPQARTLWISHQWRAASIAFPTAMALKVAVLLLESQSKTKLLLSFDRTRSPEETANVFSRRLFWWLNGLFWRGYRKALAMADLFTIDESISAHELGTRLQTVWDRRSHNTGKHTLALCLAEAFAWPSFAPVLPRLLFTGFTFAQPFLVHSVTNFLKRDRESAPDRWGYGLIGAYALVYTGIALSNGWYWHKQYRLITMLRGSLVAVIYSKTMRIELAATRASEATTLMSADVERIATGLRGMHELWATALEVGLGFWLLYRQVGLAMLSMAGLTLVCTFGASGIAQYSTIRQKSWMEAMQLRLSETIKMLASLKSIKMLGLEDRLQTIVKRLRQAEIDASHVNLFINPVLVFSAFLPISAQQGLRFDTERVFNTLTLVALVSEPLQNLLQSLPQLTMALGCVGRIQTYLLAPESHDVAKPTSHTSLERIAAEKSNGPSGSDAYLVRNGHFAWTPGAPAVLRNLNIQIPAGKLTLIVGPVASGKTSLLHALLGECIRVHGSVAHPACAVAFCAQQPWLSNTSIRSAIVGHSDDDSEWYDVVIRACDLRLDIDSLPHGDETIIGSGGAALSGGQKQRIALARGLYARTPVLLLDDVFSGLDLPTEQAVVNALFGLNGLFHTSLSSTTVVLATHAVRHLSFADHIVALLSNGEGAVQGSFRELHAQNVLLESEHSNEWEEDERLVARQKDSHPGEARLTVSTKGCDKDATEDSASDKYVLAFYVKSMGLWHGILFMVLGVLCIGLWKVSDYWARVWSEHSERNPASSRDSFYVGMYALLNSAALIAVSLWFGHFLLVVIPQTGITLHDRILGTVLSATYPFLSRTDTGTLAARFGQDLLLVDTELPMAFVNTFFEIFVILAQLGLIASASVYLLAAFPLLALAVYAVQRVYLRTSKRIRHLDLEAKAPLYAQFTDALAGIATIRAFGWQNASKAENDRLLDNSQRPFYLLFCVQRWLECVLDFTVAGLAVAVMGVAVGTRNDVGGAKIGVALLNLVTLGEHLKALVKFWTMLETTIAAVARIRSFVGTTPQEPGPVGEGGEDDEEAEQTGGMSITLENVSASYSADGPNVLSSVSLRIAPGEKVAVCGRSGSGKSSLLNALLKMLDLSAGDLLIHGRPSTGFGNRQLRRRLATIPQEPYFHPGTVRENLDPERSFTDGEIEARLARVGLDAKIAEIGGLDAVFAPEAFSAGQLQLLSLARVMLRPRGIVLFDEATSNVDVETDKKMHEVIFNDFEGQTVIAILHRREQLHRFDRVVVMDNGRVVSVGKLSEVAHDI
ncbi:Putative ABC transporter protein [Macrophomina phaseolina MS6]|uniref:Putative ABC transporter protein n=1 Tax=Macrophomina phaseolina (strain MS6) TaxID=1126212 RepID=K2R7T7_MACPH|nr:Putative ABC transporter protein [Macrophomina phaseolina MS6]